MSIPISSLLISRIYLDSFDDNWNYCYFSSQVINVQLIGYLIALRKNLKLHIENAYFG